MLAKGVPMKPAQARFRRGIGCLAVLLLAAMPLPAAPSGRAASSPARRIAAGEAAQHVGEEAMVCGLVASARYAANAAGKPTFPDFGGAFPREGFSVVIWG